MKINELLREEKEDTPDYSESMKSLVGQTLKINGADQKITGVAWKKSYGQNYSLQMKPGFKNDNHPYGAGRNVPRQLSALTGGLTVEFSESGMQGDMFLNVDVSPPRKVAPIKWKKALEDITEFAKGRGWEVVTTNPQNVILQRKGKGKLMFAYIPATEDEDEQLTASKYETFGWSAQTRESSAESMMTSMESGWMKKFFTIPKDQLPAKEPRTSPGENEGTRYVKAVKDDKEIDAMKEFITAHNKANRGNGERLKLTVYDRKDGKKIWLDGTKDSIAKFKAKF